MYCSVSLYGCRVTTVRTAPTVTPAAAMEQDVSLAAALKEGTPKDVPRREGEGNTANTGEEECVGYYDDVYFSSGSSVAEEDGEDGEGESREGGRKKKKKTKHRVLTNDELFYDPNMDEDDQKWVNRQRMAYHNGKQPHYTSC